jgi:radical SAM superfamily enzyme YgiQ (UPF0313 family)
VTSFRELRQRRLADEKGTIHAQAELAIALVYPSPYRVGMSSLGFQTIYRELNALPGVAAERAFLPDDAAAAAAAHEGLATYESNRPVGDFAIVAFSLAYELELAGLVRCLDLAGIPALGAERAASGRRWPLVVVGGPLTFSNPLPAAPMADVIVMGEAEEAVATLTEAFRASRDQPTLLETLGRTPGFHVPTLHGERLPVVLAAARERLPAYAQIVTPHSELSEMFLIEAARGCSRRCTYCVMRRSTNGGMRKAEPAQVLDKIPEHARRVGLVGAAVTDHPRLPVILRALIASGRGVGVSSLRADRLDDELVSLLAAGGYRTLTTAADGASQRLRDQVERGTSEENLLRAARLCKAHRMAGLKLYTMIGLPGETMDDLDELVRFAGELATLAPRLTITVSSFVAKRNTPLHGSPFEDIRSQEEKLRRLRTGLRGRAKLVGDSPKWGWVEYRLAQGGIAEGYAAVQAARAGGGFAAWKAALAPEGTGARRGRAIRDTKEG